MMRIANIFLLALVLLSAPAHAEWSQRKSGTTADLVDVCFVDELHGWAIGNEELWKPVIITTEDGGVTWQPQVCPVENIQLNRIFFIDDQTGFIASQSNRYEEGNDSSIFSTTDGGQTWEICYSAPYYYRFHDVCFVDDTTGWAVGGMYGDYFSNTLCGVIISTTDGGETWDTQLFTTPGENDRIDVFESIVFADELHGWALANDVYVLTPETNIYHTSDGGAHWTIINKTPLYTSYLHLIKPDTLWTSSGYLNYSYDGGNSWTFLQMVFDLSLITGKTGWATIAGGLAYTENAGESWEFQLSDDDLYIDNYGSDFACAVGKEGIIYTYKNFPTYTETFSRPDLFTLDPNYPNPFNASTTISYTLSTDSPVSIKLYSATGQLVKTLCDQHMPAGRHSIMVDGRDLASGIYFARVQVQGNTKYNRMLLLK